MSDLKCDGHTGLWNRRSITEFIDGLIAGGETSEFGIVFLDIDNFMWVNKEYTHAFGDHLLKEIAGIITRHIGDDVKAGRFGGDEFLLVFPGGEAENMRKTVEGILREVESKEFETEIEGKRMTSGATCSAGMAFYPADGAETLQLFKEADMALFRAKRTGRNRVCASVKE